MKGASFELLGFTCALLMCIVTVGCGGTQCGDGTVEQDGVCVADSTGGTACGEGTVLMGGACVADTSGCGGSTIEDPETGECVPSPDVCGSGTTYDQGSGKCVSNDTISCGPDTERNAEGECEPVLAELCGPKTEPDASGQCVVAAQSCGDGELLDPNSGECITTDTFCGENTAFDADHESCVPTDAVCDAGTSFDPDTRLCLPDACQAGDVLVAGVCLGSAEALARESDLQSTENDDPALGGTPNSLTIEPTGDAAVFTGTIAAPRDVDGDLNADQDLDVFSFDATEGQWFNVSLQSLGLPAPAFVVEGPEGFRRASPSGATAARAIAIPRDGTYTITVWPDVVRTSDGEVGPRGAAGWDYVGSISQITAPAATSSDITSMQLSGDFVQLTDNLFEVQATTPAKIVDLVVDSMGDDVDGVVQVWGGPNDFVGEHDIEAGDELTLPTPRSGRLLLLFDWREIDGPNDSYSVSGAFRPDVANLGYLDPGTTTVRGPEQVMAYDSHYYGFVVEPGTVVEWSQTNSDDESATFELQRADGTVVETRSGLRSATEYPWFDYAYAYVAEGGVLVMKVRPTSTIDDLSTQITSFRPIDIGDAGPGDSISQTVNARREWQRASYVQVDLTAPVRGELSVETPPTETMSVDVHDDQNQRVEFIDGGVFARDQSIDFKLAGRYFIRVFSESAEVTSYDVDVSFEAPPQYEYEPNDSISTASPYAMSGPPLVGRQEPYSPASRDIIEFELSAALGPEEMLLLDARGPTGQARWSCKLTDASGRVVTSNGPVSHISSCVLFTDDVIPSVPYYVHLEGSGDYEFEAKVVSGVAESEVNDSQASADTVDFAGLLGNVPAYAWLEGRPAEDFLAFTVPTNRAADEVTVFRSELISGPGSSTIRYLELIGETQGSIDQVFGDEPLEVWGLPAGDYYLRIRRTDSAEYRPSYVRVFAQEATPVCGNGVHEPSEACDDGNTVPEDGCNAQCQIVTDVCGNGVVERDEECDEGISGNTFCSSTCTYVSPTVTGGAATGATTPPGSPTGYPSVLSESTTISGCSTIDFLTVYADVEHDYDMDSTTVVLESPSGTLSMLAGREFAPRVTRVAAIYPFERQPDTPLSVMHGEVGDGTWTLYVHNRLSIEDATLHSWSVNLYCN